jgi:hypothetical protein
MLIYSIHGTNHLAIQEARVNAKPSYSFGGILTCYLQSHGRFGYVYDSDHASYSGSYRTTLSMSVDSNPGSGDYTLQCSMPGGYTYIYNYELYEQQ